MIELLAPAQNKECAFAAIDYGTDAVYIGARAFSARKNAGNSLEDIKSIVDYAHKFYVRVYVTINTIVTDDELEEVQKLINELYKIGVDAIIIQDLGILKLELPPIAMFASTQCDIRTVEKAKFLSQCGFTRIILARELSLKQIEQICKEVPDTEVETFIHGALCVSYSGQCYMSLVNGGRSANRGECAQPCRKKYSLIDENGKILTKDKYLLSLKDFNASENLSELAKIGVTSFKIEGRLKNIDYIKNVVAYYRKKIDTFAPKTSSGKVFLDFEPVLEKSFNRGFCEYFLKQRNKIYNFDSPKSMGEKLGKISKIGANYFEINFDSDKSLHPQDGLYFKNCGCLVNKIEKTKIYPNKMPKIEVGCEVWRNQDVEFIKKLENSKTCRRIQVEITLLPGKICAVDENGNFAEVMIESCEAAKNAEQTLKIWCEQLAKTGDSEFYCEKVITNIEEPIFLPISKINELRRKLLDALMCERLKNYKFIPRKQPMNPSLNKKLDYLGNVHNSLAESFYKDCGCEICEKSLELALKNPNLLSSNEVVVMRTKHCLKWAFGLCGKEKRLFLVDESGKKYKLEFDCKNCEMLVIHGINKGFCDR